jgi:hypothetical protein
MSNYACTGPNDREDTELIMLDNAIWHQKCHVDSCTTWSDRLVKLDAALSYYGFIAGLGSP